MLVHEVGDDVAETVIAGCMASGWASHCGVNLLDVGEAERQLAGGQIGLVRVLEALDQLRPPISAGGRDRIEPST